MIIQLKMHYLASVLLQHQLWAASILEMFKRTIDVYGSLQVLILIYVWRKLSDPQVY